MYWGFGFGFLHWVFGFVFLFLHWGFGFGFVFLHWVFGFLFQNSAKTVYSSAGIYYDILFVCLLHLINALDVFDVFVHPTNTIFEY